VFYDTGAKIHEFLAQTAHFTFGAIDAGVIPWSVRHLEGITRGILQKSGSGDAGILAEAHPIVLERLREGYGVSLP
jgi:hypothetical protein